MAIELTPIQQTAVDWIMSGKNVFLTGMAGTGKSEIIKRVKAAQPPTTSKVPPFAITSTTGISAQLIGGSTIHSYLGIGIGAGTKEHLLNSIPGFNKLRWTKVKTLVIDEVSMLDPELFDKLEWIARQLRHSDRPFGGIQIILSGDFLQLPVVKSTSFCFEAKSWPAVIGNNVIYLTEVIRQTDPEFRRALNEIRVGVVSEETRKLLESRNFSPTDAVEGCVVPTRIFCVNAEVDRINKAELDSIPADLISFPLGSSVQCSVGQFSAMRKNYPVDDLLHLKVGAQVMHLVNNPGKNLVNGSRGVVVDFTRNDMNKVIPLVKFTSQHPDAAPIAIDYHSWSAEQDGHVLFRLTQIPLKLAWAASVHKLQGSTLDMAEIDMGRAFEYGQVYVALSRVRTKDSLFIKSFSLDRIRCSEKALAFYQKLEMAAAP